MKLVSLNIEFNRHHNLVLPFLKNESPDIICLQELLEEDFDMYKNELGMEGIYRAVNFIYNDSHGEFYGKKEGLGIFSKSIINFGYFFHVGNIQRIERSYEEYLKDENKIKNRALLWVDIKDIDGEMYKFVNSHLTITKDGKTTDFQLEMNQIFIDQIKQLGEFVFCGDLNAPRGREAYSRIAKEFKDNIPMKYSNSLDPILHRVKGLEYMVDGLFTTPTYIATNVELKDGLSDHMAVIANISKFK